MHPVDGPVSQEYGDHPEFPWQFGFGHLGIDYAVPIGTPVRAIAPGRILWADWSQNMPHNMCDENMFIRGSDGSGIVVLAQHDGWRSVSAHLSRTDLNPGDTFNRGDIIGYVGSTGNSTGPHLHFEVFTTPCSGTPPYGRYNPRLQIEHERQIQTVSNPSPNLLIPGVAGLPA